MSGDFCVFGGIYRPVHLIATAEQNFALTDHGSPGVAWQQTLVNEQRASLDMTAQISNPSKTNRELVLTARVLDAAGRTIGSVEQKIKVAVQSTAPYSLRVEVPQPHLWNGLKDPYLYQSVVELRTKDGAVLDSVEQPLGLRFYRVDPAKDFS